MSVWQYIGETWADHFEGADASLGTSPSEVTERRIATSGNNTWPLVAATNERFARTVEQRETAT